MQDVLYIEEMGQAAALLKPARLEVLRAMAEITTCTEVAGRIGSTPQKVHYHVKALEKAGVVEKVAERKVRGVHEGMYRATAQSYWLSPRLVGRLGGRRRARDRASLGYLLSLAETVQEDVGRLAAKQREDEEIPSLGLVAEIELTSQAARAEFMQAITETFKTLAERFGGKGDASGETFQLALVCYPKGEGS